MNSSAEFPRLTPSNHRITSPPTSAYNCIAWAASDIANWWQPGVFWPIAQPKEDFSVEALVAVFESRGFEECADGSFEVGFEKLAFYEASLFYTHAARQLATGRWTSKLGRAEDIEHDSPDDLADGVYGKVVKYMRRARLA